MERVLSALNNPPTGDAALASHSLYQRAGRLMTLRDGTQFSLSDGNRLGKEMVDIFTHLIDSMENLTDQFVDSDEDVDETERWATLRRLLPTHDEVEGVFGISAGQWWTTDDGLTCETMMELPPHRPE